MSFEIVQVGNIYCENKYFNFSILFDPIDDVTPIAVNLITLLLVQLTLYFKSY